MDKVLTVLQVVMPIFVTFFLGMMARKQNAVTGGEIAGMQRFVVKFCIPCLLFRSCLTAEITPQALSIMVLLPPFQLLGLVWSYRARKRRFAYHNLPFLFCCKETGMMGIPLFMILFGVENAFRMGVLDLAQATIGFSMIAVLSAPAGTDTSPKTVVKQMLTSPMVILSILGIVLNLSGAWSAVARVGLGGVVLETVSFISQPVSAVMLFCVGYNFELSQGNRAEVFRITAIHIGAFAAVGMIVQGLLFLIPGVDALTRWAMVLYFLLPASYLAPGLGRSQQDYTIASGVCSLTTILCLAGFCVIAAMTA